MNATQRRFENALWSDPDIRALWLDIEQSSRKHAAEKAKADPRANKLTRIYDAGVNTSYRYWPAGTDGRGRKVRFCWACHRNAAGYFLGWREVEGKTQTKRDQFVARKSKAAAQEVARRRQNAWIDRSERGAKPLVSISAELAQVKATP